MKFLPFVDNTHMEGTISQIFDIGPSFDFMIKNGKPFVIIFLTFTIMPYHNNCEPLCENQPYAPLA